MMNEPSKQTLSFINRLLKWRGEYNFLNYTTLPKSQLKEIALMQNEFQIENLIAFWNDKEKQKYFELQHPFRKDVKLRAVKNFIGKNPCFHYIFLIDESNTYSAFIMQFSDLLNSIVFSDIQTCFHIYEPWRHNHFEGMNVLSCTLANLNVNDFVFKNKEFGFILGNARPLHYFLFALAFFEELDIDAKHIQKTQFDFFISNKMQKNDFSEDIVAFVPYCRSPNFSDLFWYGKDTCIYTDFQKKIYSQSVLNLNELISDEDKIDKFDTNCVDQKELSVLF